LTRTGLSVIAFFLCLTISSAQTQAAETHPAQQRIELSPELLDLLRAEMVEIAKAVQGMAVSVATADWRSIAATSAKIRASYIMEKALTAEQGVELRQALPEQFKYLDAEFHGRAEKLEAAAVAKDAERVVFQYSRLVESCVVCHSTYATSRFPGFQSSARDHAVPFH
jgi:cytochrome c556